MQSDTTEKIPRASFGSILLILLGLMYFILLGCVVAYVWVLAEDRFVSTASFKISRQNPSSGEMGFATLALPGLSDTGSVDSQIAIGFVNSSDLLMDLEKEFKLHEHFSEPKNDFYFNLNTDAPLEKRLDYYRTRIFAHFDKETGLTVLTADTFDPKLSKDIADVILQRTEAFINALNQTVADQQMSFVRGEVDRAEKKVSEVGQELLSLQNSNNLVNPDEAISANLKILEELRLSRLRAETTLTSIERDSPGSPRIGELRSQIRTLDQQFAVESAKISGPEQNRLNQVLARYKILELQAENANKMWVAAIALLEKHRIDAAARSRFVSIIQHPYMPEDVAYPRRTYATATIIVLGILLFLILRVFVQSMLERI